MRILSVGGGSGGHVTPIAAVCKKLIERDPNVELRAWCDKPFAARLEHMLEGSAKVETISSGKFRRYANLTLAQHLRYHIFKTHLRNLADGFKIAAGFVQSFVKLILWRPDVVFCKGGFVCLPAGLAAHLLRIPLVTHDSDTVPGLTNRILSRYAAKIGTGSPLENYPNYPKGRTEYVGIPVRDEIRKFSDQEKIQAKSDLGFNGEEPLVLSIGGGGGANALNQLVANIADDLTKKHIQVLLLTGKGRSQSIKPHPNDRFHIVEFMTDDLSKAIGAADLAITRAGATAIAEFAVASSPVIIIPSPHVAGDHQTKNAAVYSQAQAAVVIKQRDAIDDPGLLLNTVVELIDSPLERRRLSRNLSGFAKNDALDKMVDMILSGAEK